MQPHSSGIDEDTWAAPTRPQGSLWQGASSSLSLICLHCPSGPDPENVPAGETAYVFIGPQVCALSVGSVPHHKILSGRRT